MAEAVCVHPSEKRRTEYFRNESGKYLLKETCLACGKVLYDRASIPDLDHGDFRIDPDGTTTRLR